MTIREQLNEIGLGRLAAGIEDKSLPSLRLVPEDPCVEVPEDPYVQSVSRLGGKPNLANDVPWPVRLDEQPLAFIAQLDLAALPSVPELPLPGSGSLFFFYDAVKQPWGWDPKDKGCAKVVYSASPLEAHGLRAPDGDLDEEAQFNPIALTATQEMSLPSFKVFRDFDATEEEWEAYLTLKDPLGGPVYRMGGYADEIQGDVCLEAQLVTNGLYCGDGSGYDLGRKKGLYPGADDWRLLLQVDSDHTTPAPHSMTGMNWGDEGRLYFMIHKDDLLHRRFDNVWVILQTT